MPLRARGAALSNSPDWARPFQLAVLGRVELRDAHGSIVEGVTGRTLELLVYLAFRAVSIEREHLASLFWPNTADPRKSLRQSLYTLRTELGDGVVVGTDRVGVAPEVVALDTVQLQGFADAMHADALIRQVRGPFCANLSFATSPVLQRWFEAQAAEAVADISAAARRVARALIEQGDTGGTDRLFQQLEQAGVSVASLRDIVTEQLEFDVDDDADRYQARVLKLQGLIRSFGDHSPTRVLRLRAPSALVETLLSDAIDTRGEALPVVRLATLRDRGEKGSLAALLSELATLPGGAGADAATDRLREAWSHERGVLDDLPQASAALRDAFDSVLSEGPLLVEVPAEQVTIRQLELLSRVLLLDRGPGLLVIVHSARHESLLDAGVQALLAVAGATRPDVSSPGRVPSELEDPAPHDTPPAARRYGTPPSSALKIYGTAGAVALVVLLIAFVMNRDGRAALLESPAPSTPLLLWQRSNGEEDVYRWAPDALMPEPLAVGDAPRCADADVTAGQGAAWVVPHIRSGQGVAARSETHLVVVAEVASETAMAGLPSAPRPRGVCRLTREPFDGVVRLAHGRVLDERWVAAEVARPSGGYQLVVYDLVADSVTVLIERPEDFRPFMNARADAFFWRQWNGSEFDLWTSTWPDFRPRRWMAAGTDLVLTGLVGDTALVERGFTGDRENGSLDIGLVPLDEPWRFASLTSNDYNDHGSRISNDGRDVCWFSEEEGHFNSNVRWLNRDTGEQRVVRTGAPHSSATRVADCVWSPDGRGMLFTVYESSGPQPRKSIFYLEVGYDVPVLLAAAQPMASWSLLDPAVRLR